MWDHKFQAMLKEDVNVKDFVNSLDLQPRLDPPDAFHGGRTNCCKLYHNVKEDEKIFYKDVTSLYPYVQRYGEYRRLSVNVNNWMDYSP